MKTCTFMALSRWIIVRISLLRQCCGEDQYTRIMFSNSPPPPPPENRAVYEIMWKNMVGRNRPQMTIWPMPITCWIAKARIQTCTHCIPTATVVMRTRLIITLHVHCLSCKVLILATRAVKECLLGNFGSRRTVWKPPI